MAFILAHLSDAHIGPLPRPRWRELIGKRATGYANWLNGRARAHDMSVLAALVADIKAQGPDHIAMTGDIINLGLRAEYALGRAWLTMHDYDLLPPYERTPGELAREVSGRIILRFRVPP